MVFSQQHAVVCRRGHEQNAVTCLTGFSVFVVRPSQPVPYNSYLIFVPPLGEIIQKIISFRTSIVGGYRF